MIEPITPKLIPPTVHMNGTGINSLKNDYERAEDACQNLIDALAGITVNGRDYYPQETGAENLEQTCLALRLRCLAVQGIKDDLLEVSEHLYYEGQRLKA